MKALKLRFRRCIFLLELFIENENSRMNYQVKMCFFFIWHLAASYTIVCESVGMPSNLLFHLPVHFYFFWWGLATGWNTETELWHQNSFPGKACTGAGVRCTEGISYSITTFRALLLTNLGGAYLEPEWDSCSGTAENNNLDSFAGRSPCGFGVSCFFCQIVKFDYPKCRDPQK